MSELPSLKASAPIYMDYHATTPLDPRVIASMHEALQYEFGNPSSTENLHGERALESITRVRRDVAELVNCSPSEVFFTSGATESINLAIRGYVKAQKNKVRRSVRIGLSRAEHKAVLETCKSLAEQEACSLHWLQVNSGGHIDLDEVNKLCQDGLDLLCLTAANNEIGTVTEILAASKLAMALGVKTLCDGSQAVGNIPIDFYKTNLSFLAFSAHKMYGPKGVGVLVKKTGEQLDPIVTGGGQERGLRGGTQALHSIIGLGTASRIRRIEMQDDAVRVARLRDILQSKLLRELKPEPLVNGDTERRLPGNLNICIPGIPNSAMIARMRSQLSISSGSACNGGSDNPSHVLLAIGISEQLAGTSLRFGLGKFTTDVDVEVAGELVIKTAATIQSKLTEVLPVIR
jgi:cysteine desulfurase